MTNFWSVNCLFIQARQQTAAVQIIRTLCHKYMTLIPVICPYISIQQAKKNVLLIKAHTKTHYKQPLHRSLITQTNMKHQVFTVFIVLTVIISLHFCKNKIYIQKNCKRTFFMSQLRVDLSNRIKKTVI